MNEAQRLEIDRHLRHIEMLAKRIREEDNLPYTADQIEFRTSRICDLLAGEPAASPEVTMVNWRTVRMPVLEVQVDADGDIVPGSWKFKEGI